MTTNLELFLKKRQKKIKSLEQSPIILRWMNSPDMQEALNIIEKHVAYLLNNGGTKKLDQWFLSGDRDFNAITAERYIIGYLQRQNSNIVDNLRTDGIDAHLRDGDSSVGIEITTLNGFIVEWILIERLKQFLDESGFQSKEGLEIAYSRQRIVAAAQSGTIIHYVKDACQAILSSDNQALLKLNLTVRFHAGFPGCISFRYDSADDFSWFQDITDKLSSKLQERNKVEQLKKYPRNLVFVGLNHDSPSNGTFPRIFGALGSGGKGYRSKIQEIRAYWQSHMAKLTNVIGICYFFYSLEREEPFYPLAVFWRSDEDRLAIKL
ncbi:MAG: hypothetical protein ABIJ39_12870 [Chloroflexota bacterium]